MDACHRAVIAQTLADRLTAGQDDAMARLVVKSLGHFGNAWGWKTLADRVDEAASRETAERALVSAYVQYGGDVREAAAKARFAELRRAGLRRVVKRATDVVAMTFAES